MRIDVTDQIHLSELLPSDEAACVDHLTEKQIYEQTLRIPYPYTAADFQAWLKIVEDTTKQQGRPGHWAIRYQNGLLIGGCGFHGIDNANPHRAEIGYWLAKPYWGRGITTAVVRRLCAHLFDEH